MFGGDTVVGGTGGVVAGYVLWLAGFSIGSHTTTVSRWAPLVLLVAVGVGVCAVACGWWLRLRRSYLWSAFVFGLPVLPVMLSLAVLADLYM